MHWCTKPRNHCFLQFLVCFPDTVDMCVCTVTLLTKCQQQSSLLLYIPKKSSPPFTFCFLMKRCMFLNSVITSSATPLSHQLMPVPGWEDLPAQWLPQYTTASSGIGRQQFECVSFGLYVKQMQNKKNQDVKFARKQIPRCTVVWKSTCHS